jgi:hypothetical protein
MGEHLTDTDSGVDLKVGVCNWGIPFESFMEPFHFDVAA